MRGCIKVNKGILQFGHGMAGSYKYTHCAMEHEGVYQGKQVYIGHCLLQLCIIYGQYGGYTLHMYMYMKFEY